MNEENNQNLSSILNEKDVNEEKKSSSKTIYVIILTVFLTSLVSIYFYEYKNSKDNSLNKKSIKQEKKYVTTKKDVQEIENITKQSDLKKPISKKIEKHVISKSQRIIEEKTISSSKFYKMYHSNKIKTLKCYDYIEGKFSPTISCKNSIKKFFLTNEKAIRYQIIAVISDDDTRKYSKYNKNIQELIINGLSIKRIIEISWYIRKVLGKKIILTSNNYYVKSKKNNRGIIVKAYY